jgi:hypothetical protein
MALSQRTPPIAPEGGEATPQENTQIPTRGSSPSSSGRWKTGCWVYSDVAEGGSGRQPPSVIRLIGSLSTDYRTVPGLSSATPQGAVTAQLGPFAVRGRERLVVGPLFTTGAVPSFPVAMGEGGRP